MKLNQPLVEMVQYVGLDICLVVAVDMNMVLDRDQVMDLVILDVDLVAVLLEEEEHKVAEVWELHQRVIEQVSMIL